MKEKGWAGLGGEGRRGEGSRTSEGLGGHTKGVAMGTTCNRFTTGPTYIPSSPPPSQPQNYGDDDYLVFDCPGQIELYSHLSMFRSFVDFLKSDGWTVCVVYCLDCHFITGRRGGERVGGKEEMGGFWAG